MTRVATRIDDLLFGSRALELLRAAGHEIDAATPEVVVVDLTTGADPASIETPAGAKRLGVFAHVEPHVREAALAAGYELVVPRSRFVREGGELVSRLAADERRA